jgi:hypothetical protein
VVSCSQRAEALPTSVLLFSRGYRSVYVNEINETLSVCIEDPNRLDDKVQVRFHRVPPPMVVAGGDEEHPGL